MEDPSTKFVVPVHTADIELPTADRFCVQSVMDVGGASQEDLQAVLQGVCLLSAYHCRHCATAAAG